jgi:hypothetical protein
MCSALSTCSSKRQAAKIEASSGKQNAKRQSAVLIACLRHSRSAEAGACPTRPFCPRSVVPLIGQQMMESQSQYATQWDLFEHLNVVRCNCFKNAGNGNRSPGHFVTAVSLCRTMWLTPMW